MRVLPTILHSSQFIYRCSDYKKVSGNSIGTAK
jgi:hypothetical protein